MGKRGRPRNPETLIWEKKYYTLSDKQDDMAIRKTVQERLFKGYSNLFTLAHDKEPNQRDVATINKAVNDIIDRI